MYEDMDFQPSGSNDVLCAAQALVDYCNNGKQREQRVAATRLHEFLSNGCDLSSVVKFFGGYSKTRTKSKMEEALENTKTLFKSIEVAEDDLAVIVLCRLAEELISDSSSSKSAAKRHRRLVKIDACSAIIRMLRFRLRSSTNTSPLSASATDATTALLLAIGTKDPRITLKIRVGALIQPLCLLVADNEVSVVLLRLLCRAVRSPRNAQLCGRQKDFPLTIENKIRRLSSDRELGQLELIRLARYVEILYFITKNRKTRIQLIQGGVVAHSLTVLREQLELRSLFCRNRNDILESVSTEICLVVVALLRLLSNNKKAKDELVALGTIAMSEKGLSDLVNEGSASQSSKQLQDSLCALCLRCLPAVNFPVVDNSFPFRCPIPRSLSPSKKRSISKSPMKNESSPSAVGSSPLKKISEDPASSDDDGMDEEDEVFFSLDDTRIDKSEGDEEREEEASRRLSHSNLKSTELAEYDPYFREMRQSATVSSPTPWTGYQDSFQKNVQNTSSVVPFVKVAFPEMNNPDVDLPKQPLCMNKDSMNQTVMQHLARARTRSPFPAKVVFDLDTLYSGCGPMKSKKPSAKLSCDDVERVTKIDESKDHLLFESRFEGGNLRRATQVAPTHYELVLSPDINQVGHHYQWFYFEVHNMRAGVEYTFEIVNCLKSTSMYSKGMQPVMYSVQEAIKGRRGWTRAGDDVCYYRNLYTTDSEQENPDGEKTKKRHFFSIRFNVTFRYNGDVCYFAYHFPYTYSFMKTTLERCLSRLRPSLYCRTDTIATSIGGNPIHMLTVTGPGSSSDLVTRDLVFISARVHPGESNASWMMHGIIEQLLCCSNDENSTLLSQFVFKIVPMLNPDGVINGSHRCSLAGVDLNRVWDKPNQSLHPEIYHSKAIVQYMVDILGRTPFIFVDLHGHSRRSNVFMFGNNPEESYRSVDKLSSHNYEYLSLPEMLEEVSPSFSFKNCQFNITRGKESSARVTVWRQFGISRSYTMESTYCGFETGSYRGFQIGTQELKEMGAHLLRAILKVKVASKEPPRSTSKKTPVKKESPSMTNYALFRELGE